MKLNGVPMSIVSDKVPQFTSSFCVSLQKCLVARLDQHIIPRPTGNLRGSRIIQTLEDVLRCCILDLGGNWDDHLPLVEFTYNNSYQASISMAPYEALYGRPCRLPLCWAEPDEHVTIGLQVIEETA